MHFESLCVMALQGHAKSLTCYQSKARTCNFLLVVNSNLVPFLPRFRDIVGFLRTAIHLYSTQILGKFLLYSITVVEVPRSEDPKLINRVITFELIWPRYINVTAGQTDGRLTEAIPRNANSASRGKYRSKFAKVSTKKGCVCFFDSRYILRETRVPKLRD